MKKIVKIMLFCLLGIFAVSCGKNSSSDTGGNGEKKSDISLQALEYQFPIPL